MVAAPPINVFKPAFRQGEHHRAQAEHAGGPALDSPAAAGHGVGGAGGLLVGPAAQAPRDRRSGEHRPGAQVSGPAKDTHSTLYRTPSIHSFRGAKWTDVKKPERRQYLKNAYRVLLTRARQAMVIFVPLGAKCDKTRSPGFYERVSQHLVDQGVAEV